MNLNIVADENMTAVAEVFAPLGNVQLKPGRELLSADLGSADVLLVRSVTRVDEALLADSAVRFVGTATSGFDHIDAAYLARREIGFAYAPGSNANSVIEYVIAAIASCDDFLERCMDGGRVGIVGYGVIGQRLAQRLAQLGIASLAYDPWLDRATDPRLQDLEAVLACDVISVHAELTRRQPWPSFHLLGAQQLAMIDAASLLISAGRGAVLDTTALHRLLEAEPARRVVLDVWENEPQVDPGLLQQCFLATPHIAGYSHDGKVLAVQMLYAAACQSLGVTAPAGASVPQPAYSIAVPESLRGADLVRWLQQQSYDIRADDRRMRAQMGSDFDALRRQYPRRYELSSCELANARQLDAEQLALCRGLGLPC